MATRASDLFRFTFQVDRAKQVDVLLGTLKTAVGDLTPVWRDIHQDFIQGEQEQFDSEGNSGSGGWAALSPPYAAWKSMVAPGAPILVLSGALRGSLTDGRHSDAIYQPQRLGVTMGTRVPIVTPRRCGW
jgi:hypothetical protein